MNPIYHIDPSLDIPIYQQLVDAISADIQRGTLENGRKLPTVQELSQSLSIARGTIKRAYDELELRGLVEKVQGRGTFVRHIPPEGASRKDQAMAAIDEVLDRLERMGFSPAEINIFLNLKLRDRAEREASIQVAVVADCPEHLDQMAAQVRAMDGVEVYSFLLEQLRRYPYQLGEEQELVVCLAEHADFLQSILPPKQRIAQVALRPRRAGLRGILELCPGARVGVLGSGAAFTNGLLKTIRACREDLVPVPPVSGEEPGAYLSKLDAVLVPEGWEKLLPGLRQAMSAFPGTVVPCAFKMDEGSMLYLTAKIKRLLDAKTI